MDNKLINKCNYKWGDKLAITVAGNRSTEAAPPWIDLRVQMPVNTQPDQSWLKSEGRTGWWQRTLDQIDGITIHHTMVHDMPFGWPRMAPAVIA